MYGLFRDVFIPGRAKARRAVDVSIVFAWCEVVGLVGAFLIWLVAGFGYSNHDRVAVRRNYALLGWWLRRIVRSFDRSLGLRMELPEDATSTDRPVLVFSRHAGPGDSVFIADALMHEYHRLPRIVGKKELEFSPFFDTMGHRLPMRFIHPNPKDRDVALEAVRDAASNLGHADAFVLFPEGGNFTHHRRERAIEHLVRRGLTQRAELARGLRHVLPPHTAGPFAALDEAPDADVVFVAHTGSEDLVSPAVIWDLLPLDRTIRVTTWFVPRADVPTERDERVDWLMRHWVLIDDWIDENRIDRSTVGSP